MKWWTRQQAEGAHLRLLYTDGGSEDGTAEAHLQTRPRPANTPARATAFAVMVQRSGRMSY